MEKMEILYRATMFSLLLRPEENYGLAPGWVWIYWTLLPAVSPNTRPIFETTIALALNLYVAFTWTMKAFAGWELSGVGLINTTET